MNSTNHIEWRFNGQEMKVEGDKKVLRIQKFDTENDGIYECEVNNIEANKLLTKKFFVAHKSAPKSTLSLLRRQSNSDVQSLQIVCEVSGWPFPLVLLLKDRKQLNILDEETIQINHIKYSYEMNLTAEDPLALYTCNAINKLGNHSSRMNVVSSLPSKPQIYRVNDFSVVKFFGKTLGFRPSTSECSEIEVINIAPMVNYKIVFQRIDLLAKDTLINISQPSEFFFAFDSMNEHDFYDKHQGFRFSERSLNLKMNSVYNIRVSVSNVKGYSDYSDWYTYVTTHICGNDVRMMFDGVNLASHENYGKSRNVHPKNYTCSSRISTSSGNKICVRMTREVCNLQTLTLHDNSDESSLILRPDCGDERPVICSASESVHVHYDSPKESFGFYLNFFLKNKSSLTSQCR
ncbi:Fasciclin-2-like protein [Dinothrombium tinctorium]|uniref:Fasciclin-2-like protein n=1 Tax=Dinothrombium tinctorium TaxID=1965070 RepID=A0A443QL47_9ACAR|nr:Fasciclin-2-like protein [Dinothrombium tinctorium]RWS03845.1 Fasciclin-2-like protein [Dinothrombium tinctorium]RWS04903.1 Fasciclin-2-like protein [Dinothrombium tinctorium]